MASRPVKAANDPETQDAKTPPLPNGDTRHQSSQDGMPPNSNAQKIGPNETDMSISRKQVTPQPAREAATPASTSVSTRSSDDAAPAFSARVRRCLIDATTRQMKLNAVHIGFKEVRDRAEAELGWTGSRFTKFDDSDMIIKREVDRHCKAQGLPRPRNATWKALS